MIFLFFGYVGQRKRYNLLAYINFRTITKYKTSSTYTSNLLYPYVFHRSFTVPQVHRKPYQNVKNSLRRSLRGSLRGGSNQNNRDYSKDFGKENGSLSLELEPLISHPINS